MKRCFFIGHREAGDEVLPLLRQEVERHDRVQRLSDRLCVASRQQRAENSRLRTMTGAAGSNCRDGSAAVQKITGGQGRPPLRILLRLLEML